MTDIPRVSSEDDFLAFDFNSPRGNQNDEYLNVYIIGSMGAGKSTLANYLYNLGKTQKFKTGTTPGSVTREVQIENIYLRRGNKPTLKIRLHDTPGLNEVDQKIEFTHMWSVLETFSKEKYVSCIVICVPEWRLDNQTLQTMEYYSKLFKPVFLSGNVLIIKTKLDAETYDELANDNKVREKAEELLDAIKNTNSIYKNISFIELMNCKTSASNRDRIIHCLSSIEHNRNIEVDDVYIHSLYARLNVLEYISQCNPISIEGYGFPLPPIIDLSRKAELNALYREQAKEIETTEKYNREHAELLREIRDAEKSYSEMKSEHERIKYEIEELKRPIITSKKTLSGADWFKILNSYVTLTSNYPYDIPQSKWKKHNCELTVRKSWDTGAEVVISPYAFLLFREWINNNSWFADIWLECDGKINNSAKISEKVGEERRLAGIVSDKENILNTIRNKAREIKTELGNSLNLEKETSNRISILSLEEYNSSNVRDALQYISLKSVSK